MIQTFTEEQAKEKHGADLFDHTISQFCANCCRLFYVDDFVGFEEPEKYFCPHCRTIVKNKYFNGGK